MKDKDILWIIWIIVSLGLAVFYDFLPWNAITTFSMIIIGYFITTILADSIEE